MKIGILLPSIYASQTVFPDRIFAPRELATWVSNGLIDAGNDVVMYSTDDMSTRARLVSVPLDGVSHPFPYQKFESLPKEKRAFIEEEFPKHAFEMELTARAFRDLETGGIDVLHVYMDSSLFYAHYFVDVINKPVVFTLHDPLPKKDTFEHTQFSRFVSHSYVSISDSQRQSDLNLNFIQTVYHGIDAGLYTYVDTPDAQYLFIGRMVKEKGLDDAIKACVISNASLSVASHFPKPHESEYFDQTIAPLLDYPHLRKIGMVTDGPKIKVLGHSKALLFPIRWEEPFGMVMIEAMACGTPVIAYNGGSVSEIIRDGVTGFIIDPPEGVSTRPTGKWSIKKRGIEGLVEAMGRIGEIKRTACRDHVVQNFSIKKMVDGYEHVYKTCVVNR